LEKPLHLLARIHVIRLLRKALRVGGLLLLLAAIVVGSAFSVFNWWFLPRLEQFRPQLEASLSRPAAVRFVAALSGQWQGVAPRLQLGGLRIANPVSGEALTLQQVTVLPSWWSLLSWQPLFSSIVIQGPVWRWCAMSMVTSCSMVSTCLPARPSRKPRGASLRQLAAAPEAY
jgi:hypothetical protein